MELALVLRELWARRRVVALGVIIGAAIAILAVYQVSTSGLKPRALQYSSASSLIFVDTPTTALGDVTADVGQLQARATVLGNFMASPTIVDAIAKQVGLSGYQIYAAGPVDVDQPRAVVEPTELKRNVQVTGETDPYRMEFLNDPTLPTIGINTQAPTTKMALALANASVVAIQQYVTQLEALGKTPKNDRVVIRSLGPAIGGVVDTGITKKLAILIGLAVFLLWCGLVLVGARFRAAWKASRKVYEGIVTGIAPAYERPTLAQATTNGDGANGNGLRSAEAALAALVAEAEWGAHLEPGHVDLEPEDVELESEQTAELEAGHLNELEAGHLAEPEDELIDESADEPEDEHADEPEDEHADEPEDEYADEPEDDDDLEDDLEDDEDEAEDGPSWASRLEGLASRSRQGRP